MSVEGKQAALGLFMRLGRLVCLCGVFSEGLNVPSSELGGLPEMMESYSRDKVMRFFMKFVAMGKEEGCIHKDQTEETTILYFTMYKNELGRQWEAGNQELVHRSMDALTELFFFGLVGQAREKGSGPIRSETGNRRRDRSFVTFVTTRHFYLLAYCE